MKPKEDEEIAILERIIDHISGWISDPTSLFFDPEMTILFNKLLNNAFNRLVKTFRSFGAEILYADHTKILIDTKKMTLTAAQGYTEFLLSSIQKNKNFSMLSLEASFFWSSLIFKDEYNFAGLNAETVKNKI